MSTPMVRMMADATWLVLLATTCGVAEEDLSGIKWQEPPVVTPGKADAEPPSDAVVLGRARP